MKRITLFFLVVISLAAGYILGSRTEIFSSRSTSPPYMYNLQLPKELAGEGVAFSGVVSVISPVVANISTSKTLVNKEPSSSPHLFDGPFSDFFDYFNVPKKWKEQSLGSGVVVSPDGFIITNNHVVEKSDEITVTLYDQQTYKGKIIGTDPKTDIAVIKIPAQNLPSIQWGDSEKLQVGEFVLAFGNPYSLGHTVTMGIVSAVGRANVGIADYENFIQTDAAINPGNSGGPLVNIKGELVGINTAIFSRTGGYQGIGFAVPSNMAKSVMTQLISEGKVTRGWLGVTIQNLTPELAKEFGIEKPVGALVTDIFRGSPAEKAGIRRGDVILQADSKKIKDVESLRNTIAQSKVGSTIEVTLLREGKNMPVSITITEFPRDIAQAEHGGPADDFTEKDNELAGLRVMDLSRDIARQLGLSNSEQGVVVVRVDPYSAAEEAGLKKGDVIQEINKQKVRDLADFNKLLPTIRQGDTVLLFVNRSGNKFYASLKTFS
ncbi:MAG: DegQ family serine endoprotease [Nitrospiraceae bacterium]|nr:MAG: DegQ family serine endoprotease [Nitrospiraceae bacterium]